MNILIIRFSALGDLVTLEPTFRAFRHFFSNAHITFLTSSIGKGLYEDTPYFDEFIIHKNFLETLKQIRMKHYDLVINLQCSKPSHYLNLFVHKQKTINKSFNLFQKIFKIKTHSKNAYEMLSLTHCNTKVLKEYFNNPLNTLIQFPSTKEEVQPKSIAISTGSSPRWGSKQWGLKNYEQLIERLLAHDCTVVLVGSKLEEADATYLSQKFPSIQNQAGKTSLGQLKTLLATVVLYIGNDSGPTHIAAAVGTDTLTIFGPTDIQHSPKFGSYRGTHLYIKPSSDIACHPCYKGTCPTKLECMRSIHVNEVSTMVLDHIKGTL
jgi:ADP-heptose:LPS heptosyltransferase